MTLDELVTQVRRRSPDGTPLDQLAEAAELAAYVDELADHLVGHFVDQARRSGASWTAIGQSMGVTKQAVQKRFVGGEPSLERFTNRAKVVVLKAQNIARERGEPEVTSLHLVLGLLAEWEGLAGQAIEAAGVSREQPWQAPSTRRCRAGRQAGPPARAVLAGPHQGARAQRPGVAAAGARLRRHRAPAARARWRPGRAGRPGPGRRSASRRRTRRCAPWRRSAELTASLTVSPAGRPRAAQVSGARSCRTHQAKWPSLPSSPKSVQVTTAYAARYATSTSGSCPSRPASSAVRRRGDLLGVRVRTCRRSLR